MQIQGVGNQQAWQLFKSKQDGSKSEVDKATNVQGNVVAKATSQTVEASQGKTGEKGVIRLLEAGHFKGVADVRLRINFYEELQQIASQEAEGLMESKGPELVNALDDKVQSLGIDNEFSDEVSGLMETFEGAVSSAVTGTKDGQFDVTAALGKIEKAFDDLFVELNKFTPASGEVAVVNNTESVAAADAVSEVQEPIVTTTTDAPEGGNADAVSSDPFTIALGELQKWFGSEMASIADLVTNSTSLSPLSEARGNGKAYARFLETYNALQNTTGATTGGSIESTPVEGVQAVA